MATSGRPGDLRWERPPVGMERTERWDRWCHEMRRDGHGVWAIAQRLGVSENKVLRACERVKSGRWDG